MTQQLLSLCLLQRIPSTKSKQASSACEEASHVHRHFIKGWTTDPNANGSYRSLKRRESSDTRQPQPTPEYHPIGEHDTLEMDSTGGNDEECRTSLIVLPSYSENSGSDGVTGKDGVTCKDYCSCAFKEFYLINLKLNET